MRQTSSLLIKLLDVLWANKWLIDWLTDWLPSVLWHFTALVGRQEEHLACKNWVMGTGVVICLECDANDLHTVQLMPLPSIVSCFSKIQNGLPVWCRLTQIVLEKRPLNVCVCVCVRACSRACARVCACISACEIHPFQIWWTRILKLGYVTLTTSIWGNS